MNRASIDNHLKRYAVYYIAAVALIIRLLYLLDIHNNPFFYQLTLDRASYDLWAQELAAGDWLGHEVFYQTPLYPYFLAIIYKLFGRRLLLVYLLQALLGAAHCMVIYGIGRLAFNRKVGLIAGSSAALYKVFIFYGGMILKSMIGVLLVDLAFYFALKTRESSRIFLTAAVSGMALGLACLARENFIVALPLIFIWLVFADRQKIPRQAYIKALVFLIGASCVLVSSLVRNYAVGGDFVLITAQGGQNFYIGAHLGNDTGAYRAPEFVGANPFLERKDFKAEALRRTGREDMLPSEISSFWYGQALKEISQDKALFIKRFFLKMKLLFGHREVSDNLNYEFFKRHYSTLLKLPLPTFGLICPLGIMGIILALVEKRGRLLAGFVVLYCLTVLLFFVFGRYRLALVSAFLIYGAFFLTSLYSEAREGSRAKAALMVVGLLPAVILTHLPAPEQNFGVAYFNLGNVYMSQGRMLEAISAYEKAADLERDNYAMRLRLGQARERAGDLIMAEREYLTALGLKPSAQEGYISLASLYIKSGRCEEALAVFDRAQGLIGESAKLRSIKDKALECLK